MARGVNKVILIGNLGRDPEVQYMPSGDAVANLSLATSESWKDKQTGDQKERTEWHKVIFFGRRAEVVGEYCRKGSKLYVEGSLRTRKWQDQSGADRYSTEIVGKDVQFLDSKGASGYPADQRGPAGPDQARAAAGMPPREQSQEQPPLDEFDDDIPF